MEVSGQLHAPVALIPRKEPQYSLDRRLGGLQSRLGRGAEEKIPYRKSNPDRPACNLLYSLNYHGSRDLRYTLLISLLRFSMNPSYWDLTIQVSNLISIFRCPGSSKESVAVRCPV